VLRTHGLLSWAQVAQPDLSSRKVLIVDDDEFACRLLEEAVRALGYEPMSMESVGEALSADLTQFCAVICDFAMPIMDGAEVLEAMRDWRGAGIPFLFVTSTPNEPRVQQAAAQYRALVLPKPVDIAELGEHLRQMLAARA
jgi:CheY-like chemotaxis protein